MARLNEHGEIVGDSGEAPHNAPEKSIAGGGGPIPPRNRAPQSGSGGGSVIRLLVVFALMAVIGAAIALAVIAQNKEEGGSLGGNSPGGGGQGATRSTATATPSRTPPPDTRTPTRTPTPLPTPRPPGLYVGSGVVITNTGACLRLRTSPSLNGNEILCMAEGAVGRITGGPRRADGLVWWQVAGTFGGRSVEGWAAERDASGTVWLTER